MRIVTEKEDDVLLLISHDNWKTHNTVILYKGKEKAVIKLSLWNKIKLFLINHYS